jgi:hypothetical protein
MSVSEGRGSQKQRQDKALLVWCYLTSELSKAPRQQGDY